MVSTAPPPNPPNETFADDVVRAGELLYADYCGRCHGNATRSINVIPDLRRSPALTSKELWHSIVIDGVLYATSPKLRVIALGVSV